MALLVFLPLNGNIYNYGLSNVIVANNGSVDLTLNGKLGKCATFGSSNYLSATIPNSSNTFSVSWWLYLSTVNTGLMPWGIGAFNPIYSLCLNTGDGTNNPWYVPGTTTRISQFTSGWHHFVVTGDGTTNKLYLDGVHYGNTKTYRALKDYGTSLRISGWPINNDYKFNNGKISDFRLYDHVLSNKEVNEIAKGLVLHYPMNYEYVLSTVYDCSGYCNNGTINGTLTVSSDTARYLKSSRFGAYQSPYIDINPTFVPSISNGTVSWWFKPTTSGAHLLLTGQSTSYYIAAGNSNTNLYHYNAGSPVLYVDGIRGNSTYKDGWHHYCLVGVNFSIWTKMYINNYSSRWPVNGLVSDLRIYSTALSEEDVKELYNTSAIINNNNTLEAYEFAEGTTYNINKSGVMTGKDFTEHNEEVLINNTEQVFATEFIEI